MKKCYQDNCSNDVEWYIWIDGSLACDAHAPGDYSEPITKSELRDFDD